MHLLCYLKATKEEGIYLSAGDFQIRTYTDADWGGNLDTRRSTSGILITLGKSVILWKSKGQITVAHSTMEAEFKALANGVSYSLWLEELLRELGSDKPGTNMFCDNQGCILALNGKNYIGRSKHNEIHFHVVKERMESSTITVNYIQSEENVADMLTKILTKDKLQYLKQKLNIGA